MEEQKETVVGKLVNSDKGWAAQLYYPGGDTAFKSEYRAHRKLAKNITKHSCDMFDIVWEEE